MAMNRLFRILAGIWSLVGIAVLVVSGYVCYLLQETAQQVKGADVAGVFKKANSSLDSLNATLLAINSPCTSFHGSTSCGVLAQLSQTEKNFGIVAGQSAEQVKQSGQLITAAAGNINLIGQHVNSALDVFAGTSKQATTDLASMNDLFLGAKPLVSHLDAVAISADISVERFNAMLASPQLATITTNFESMSGSGVHIMQTTDQVETKLAKCTLHPTFGCTFKSDAIFGAQLGGYILGGIH